MQQRRHEHRGPSNQPHASTIVLLEPIPQPSLELVQVGRVLARDFGIRVLYCL